MNEKENRTISITFRISPKCKMWLDELVTASGLITSSEYLNNQIRLRRRSLIVNKAMIESKLAAGKELGLTEKMSQAIEGPEDIIGLPNGDKALKTWLTTFEQNVKKEASEIGMEDILENLSSTNGIEILEFFFNNYSKIKILNSIFDETNDSLKRLKTGR